MEAARFHINPGDELNIAWHGNYDQIRFSLAYCNNGTSSDIPMVSVVVGDCNSETDLLTLNTLNCECVTIAPPSSGISGTQTGTVTEEANNTGLLVSTSTNQIKAKLITVSISVVISTVIVCSLLLIVITILFVHQQKIRLQQKRIRGPAYKCRRGYINEAYSTNAIHTESNIAYSTSTVHSTTPHDYDYVVL